MTSLLLIAAMLQPAPPPAGESPTPSATRCRCPCKSDICRCSSKGGCTPAKTMAKPATKPAPAGYREDHSGYWHRQDRHGNRIQPSPQEIEDHLVNEHGFDRAYVRSLSYAARETLHKDAHEGKVQKHLVKSARTETQPVALKRVPIYAQRQVCNGWRGCRWESVIVGYRWE